MIYLCYEQAVAVAKDVFANYGISQAELPSTDLLLLDKNEALPGDENRVAFIQQNIAPLSVSFATYTNELLYGEVWLCSGLHQEAISQIETLLNYAERIYQRQFITWKISTHKILNRLEDLLSDYFNNDKSIKTGLPTVQFVSEELNVSPNYLRAKQIFRLRSLGVRSVKLHRISSKF